MYAVQKMNKIVLCPFCRTIAPDTQEEAARRGKKRVEAGDAIATRILASAYMIGDSLPQDNAKANELMHRAAELGDANAYSTIGSAYSHGDNYSLGVERDNNKTIHFWELAALMGHAGARHCLGNAEVGVGNMSRAVKHYTIALRGGYMDSLIVIKQLYMRGDATKDEYTKALRAYQMYLDEVSSDDRDKAAASRYRYRYHGNQRQGNDIREG